MFTRRVRGGADTKCTLNARSPPASGRSVLTPSSPSVTVGHASRRLRSSSALAHPHVLLLFAAPPRPPPRTAIYKRKDMRVLLPPLRPPKKAVRSQALTRKLPYFAFSPVSRRPRLHHRSCGSLYVRSPHASTSHRPLAFARVACSVLACVRSVSYPQIVVKHE